MRDTQPMGLKYHAFFCCCTLFGSYPMSVVFILSYWKLPWGEFFREKRRVKSEEKRKNKNFSQKQGVGSSEGSLPLGEGSSRLCETDEGWDAVSSMNGRGGGMPRPHEFRKNFRRGVCLPCVGGGGCPLGQTEGVYGSNFVGDYRTMAFTVSIAYTPSVTALP